MQESSGKINAKISSVKNVYSTPRGPHIVNVNCKPNNSNINLFSYAFSVSQDAYSLNVALNEAHPSAMVDLSFGGEYVNVTLHSITLGDGLLVGYDTYAVTYEYDSALNTLTIAVNEDAPFEKNKTYIDDINVTFIKDGEFSSRRVTVKVDGVEGHVEPGGGCITPEEFNDLHHEITEEEARQLIEEVNNGTE